jgi:TRAP-type C4-dicarboxylate transport system permease small subunit
MKFINKAEKMMNFINKRLSEICGVLLFIIIILLLVNVFSREVGLGIEGLSNLSVVVLISVVYLGLSTTEQYKQHAAVEILDYKLSKKNRRTLHIIVNVIKLGTIMIFTYAAFGNFQFAVEAKESFADVVYIPMWPSKLALLIGILFFAFQILLNLSKSIIDPEYLDEVSDDLTANL